jgi:hypothetical protein
MDRDAAVGAEAVLQIGQRSNAGQVRKAEGGRPIAQ